MGNRNRSPPHRSPPPPSIWAYGYEIAQPLAADRLRSIEKLLEKEQTHAKRRARTWASRFVVEERVTHILVLSDSPDQRLDINRRLEEELEKMKIGFSISPPVVVTDPDEPGAPDDLPAFSPLA